MPLHQISAFLATSGLIVSTYLNAGCTNTRNLDPVTFEDDSIEIRDQETRSASLVRDHWAPIPVSVPAGTVEHAPTYVTMLDLDGEKAGERGEYPTVDTVIGFPENTGETAAEAALAYPHAGWLFLKAPIEMLQGRWPWDTVESDPIGYERLPWAPAGAITNGPESFENN